MYHEKWQNSRPFIKCAWYFKGCGMGPWLVLVFPCFRENVVATCKIGYFLCSLDHLLQKNVIVLFFWKSNFKMALIWKRGCFWPTFHIFYSPGKSYKIFLQHISQTHTYTYFAHPTDFFFFFCPTNFEKKNTNLSGTVSLCLWYKCWSWFLFAPFWNNQ